MAKQNYEAKAFGNGVVIVNTTPHPVSIQDTDGSLVAVPQCGVLINARTEETAVSPLLVKTTFVGNVEGSEIIADIKRWFSEQYGESDSGATLVILGSIIAAQAYPGEVLGMCPVPGYERVAPQEKRMRCDRFTTFA